MVCNYKVPIFVLITLFVPLNGTPRKCNPFNILTGSGCNDGEHGGENCLFDPASPREALTYICISKCNDTTGWCDTTTRSRDGSEMPKWMKEIWCQFEDSKENCPGFCGIRCKDGITKNCC